MFTDDEFDLLGLGLAAAIALGLSFLAPAFVADQLGYAAEFRELVAWATRQPAWVYLPLGGLYMLGGFFGVVIAGSAIFAIGYILFKAIAEATFWLWEVVRYATARLVYGLYRLVAACFLVITWPIRLIVELVWHGVSGVGRRISQAMAEARELRRVYREEYRDQFRSFREFKAAFEAANDEGRRARNTGGEHSRNRRRSGAERNARHGRQEESDLFAQAVRMFGLSQDFTREELKRRYRDLMKQAHPDAGGSHEQASAVNWAHNLIKKRKGWA